MSGTVVGLDVGGTNVRGLALFANDEVSEPISVERPRSPDGLVAAMVEVAFQAAAGQPRAIGVGCAGLIDRTGRVRASPNIPELANFPLRDALAAAADVPVVVDNDATTAAWAESCLGAARDVPDMVFVALGTGIGAGLVADGHLIRGAAGFAGEAGHMVIVEGGRPCPCGRLGCWEQYGSGNALGRFTREFAKEGRAPSVVELAGGSPTTVRSEHVADLVGRGESEAIAILDELGRWIALGLTNLVNILDPAMVVLGGGLADIGLPLVHSVRRGYQAAMTDAEAREPMRIELSKFAGRAGAIGAALLARAISDDNQ